MAQKPLAVKPHSHWRWFY